MSCHYDLWHEKRKWMMRATARSRVSWACQSSTQRCRTETVQNGTLWILSWPSDSSVIIENNNMAPEMVKHCCFIDVSVWNCTCRGESFSWGFICCVSEQHCPSAIMFWVALVPSTILLHSPYQPPTFGEGVEGGVSPAKPHPVCYHSLTPLLTQEPHVVAPA